MAQLHITLDSSHTSDPACSSGICAQVPQLICTAPKVLEAWHSTKGSRSMAQLHITLDAMFTADTAQAGLAGLAAVPNTAHSFGSCAWC